MVFVSCLSMAVLMHKDSARRAQWQKTACRFFALPSRRLSYLKIVQGERNIHVVVEIAVCS